MPTKSRKENSTKHLRYLICLILLSNISACSNLPFTQTPTPANKPKPSAQQGNGNASTPTVNTDINSSKNYPQSGGVSSSDAVVLSPNVSLKYSADKNLIGFNTGFMFTTPMDEQPEVKKIVGTLSPSILRFSGGTISSYYHPDGLGYGFKEAEVHGKMEDLMKTQPLFKQNAMVHFADVCQISGSKIIYVANLLTGTVDEMVKVLEYFKSRKLDVVGVELGNEYFFKAYWPQFPSVNDYIKACQPYVQVLRKQYPGVKIGAIAAMIVDKNAKSDFALHMRTWDQTLGKETFYDAYTVHLYLKGEVCEQKAANDVKSIFPCTDVTLSLYKHNYQQITFDYFKQFYGNKKYWVTEWNIDKPDMLSNTFTQAAFVTEYIMTMIDHNISNNNVIEYANFHNFGSAGYAYPIFSYATQAVPTINGDKTIAYNASYYPFLIYSQILNQQASKLDATIARPLETSNQNLNIQCFLSKDGKKLYAVFQNKTGKTIPLQMKLANATPKFYQALEAKFPWSVAGMNGFYKKQPAMVDRMNWVQKNITSSDIVLPAYAIGSIEYQLP